MYHIFFQPFDASEAFKKGTNKGFSLMLLIGSLLAALACVLFINMSSHGWMQQMMSGISLSTMSYVQIFLVVFTIIVLANLVRAFFLHLVMKIFTDKGSYIDALKVAAVHCYLGSVYVLIAIILGAIPVVGLGLAALVFAVGVIITFAVSLRGLAILYKTDIITTWVAISVLIVSVMATVYLSIMAVISMTMRNANWKSGMQNPDQTPVAGSSSGMMQQYFQNQYGVNVK